LMEAQAQISLKKNQALVGRTFEAVVDEVDNQIAIARIYSQAPEIDGMTIIEKDGHDIKAGDIVSVVITEAYDYDLKARIFRHRVLATPGVGNIGTFIDDII